MLETFRPLIDAARGLDFSDAAAAEAELNRRFDPGSPAAQALTKELVALMEAGKIAERGELPVRYGRVSKAVPETLDHSIDVVLMNGPGPLHRHPAGEADFCIALDGQPTFDGRPPGWVVYGPGSEHVPTVAGGTMLIVYLLPTGAIEFL
ncbi:DUF4863 family protein [Engelhardtia mirabilis]|uniref:ChrR Cupin-like domain protein n=1 Tax=Engelhardtia mirabilis TaxID=2528011 RepID=A0A518BLC0_9BACT|nr:hypothetical protein Pla133_28600 [Planctomycetes bacterium Pla133]QDV02097.1 hypothetical protein Pla86_28590 [Planctomycetes bacterium Pla86]